MMRSINAGSPDYGDTCAQKFDVNENIRAQPTTNCSPRSSGFQNLSAVIPNFAKFA
jgi:hypothetical protein